MHTHSSVVITEPLLCARFAWRCAALGCTIKAGIKARNNYSGTVWRLNGGYEKLVVGFAGQLRCRLRTQRTERDDEVGAEVGIYPGFVLPGLEHRLANTTYSYPSARRGRKRTEQRMNPRRDVIISAESVSRVCGAIFDYSPSSA